MSCCRFPGHRVKVDEGTGGWQWDDDGLTGLSSSRRYSAERYVPSTRPYGGFPDLDYPLHDRTVTVTTCCRICFNRQKDYDLGYFDDETCRLEPLENPFGPKVLPMFPE